MSEFTTRVVVDGGDFSPSVELCLAESRRRGQTRLIPVSGRLMSDEDIDGMVDTIVVDVLAWARDAKQQLKLALHEQNNDGASAG